MAVFQTDQTEQSAGDSAVPLMAAEFDTNPGQRSFDYHGRIEFKNRPSLLARCLLYTAIIISLIEGGFILKIMLSTSSTRPMYIVNSQMDSPASVKFSQGVRPPILGPEFPRKTVTFIKDEHFMGPPEVVHNTWAPYLDEDIFAAMSFDWDSGRGYGVSGYHQLHCVWMFLQSIYMAIEGTKPEPPFEGHALHCVEYLRQSVICAADNTIERSYMGIFGTFEANNTHVCRDWDALMEWAHENVYHE